MDDPNACEDALLALYGEETLDLATDLIDGEVRFFGLSSPGLDLNHCELHQRLLGEYAKTRAPAVNA
jgi:ribosomal protein S12 methylthiotransferase accessory factor